MKLAIIPARGGSKRIPRKNIKPFCGQPMIAWSVQAALRSQCFDKVVVSTDDTEIARVAIEAGAQVPFFRPADLAGDYVGTSEVVRHAIEWFQRYDQAPSLVCCIYATAPFIREEDIRRGLGELVQSDANFAFTVTSYAFPIQRAVRLTDEGRIDMLCPQYFQTRSQDLEARWHDAGQFYWGRSQAWLSGTPLFTRRSLPIILPRHLVQDIDTDEDWDRAEWMWEAMRLARSEQ